MGNRMNAISVHTATKEIGLTGSPIPETGFYPARIMKKFTVLIPMIVSFLAVHSFAYQQKESEEEMQPPALTEEEKEIMNDREMLENLALLENLDAIAFLDLLNEMDPEWTDKDEPVLPEKEPEESEEEGDKP